MDGNANQVTVFNDPADVYETLLNRPGVQRKVNILLTVAGKTAYCMHKAFKQP